MSGLKNSSVLCLSLNQKRYDFEMKYNKSELNAISGIKIELTHMCSESILGAFNSVVSLALLSVVAHCHLGMPQGKSKGFLAFCILKLKKIKLQRERSRTVQFCTRVVLLFVCTALYEAMQNLTQKVV